MAFFASPAKGWLIRQLKIRNASTPSEKMALQQRGPSAQLSTQGQAQRPDLGSRTTTHDSSTGSMRDGYGGLGLPDDPQREVEEAVEEIKGELEVRQRRGSKITVPTGGEMRRLVEERLRGKEG